jgi:tripartite-type tricarboxylate transporter receptor subunit TctC
MIRLSCGRRHILQGLVSAGVLVASGARSQISDAKNYPDRPVKMVVGTAPGGFADILARMISEKLSVSLGQPFVVQNMPGASGAIAANAVAHAAPDGYTLILTSAVLVQLPQMSKTAYDPFRDFSPVASLGSADLVLLVNPSNPASTVGELVQNARERKMPITYGSPGAGTVHNLTFELFKKSADAEFIQVPYKGATPMITALLGGEIQATLLDMANCRPMVQTGKLKALAIASEKRSAFLPGVRTFVEQSYPKVVAGSISWLLTTAKTPPAIVARLSQEVAVVMTAPDLVKRFADLGFEGNAGSSAELTSTMRSEYAKWKTVITEANIKVDQ